MSTTFPPERHVMRDLATVSQQLTADRQVGVAPLPDGTRDRAGHPSIGLLATLIDANAGPVVLLTAQPDWTATADLSVQSTGLRCEGPLVVDARLLRVGSRLIVVRTTVHDGRGVGAHALLDELAEQPEASCGAPLVATGLLSFVRMPSSRSAVGTFEDFQVGVRRAFAPTTVPDAPLVDRIGLRHVDGTAGAVELDRSDYVRNSMGAVTGGVHAMAMQAAAEDLCQGLVAVGLEIRYLAAARVGTLRAVASTVRSSADAAVCSVDVYDLGRDALVSTGTVLLGHETSEDG